MSAVLHVRCPIDGCGETIDSVIETETWGSTTPGDHGCGNVTLNDSAMTNHIAQAHTGEDTLRTLVKHYEESIDAHTRSLSRIREQFGAAQAK